MVTSLRVPLFWLPHRHSHCLVTSLPFPVLVTPGTSHSFDYPRDTTQFWLPQGHHTVLVTPGTSHSFGYPRDTTQFWLPHCQSQSFGYRIVSPTVWVTSLPVPMFWFPRCSPNLWLHILKAMIQFRSRSVAVGNHRPQCHRPASDGVMKVPDWVCSHLYEGSRLGLLSSL